MAERRKIIIDTDPGQDDAAAIMLAFGSPEDIEILGLCAVAGNVPLKLTSRNIRIICELCGRTDIPVYEGAEKPLVRKPITAEHVHGSTGLDGPVLDEPTMEAQKQHAVDFIIETLMREPAGTVTLCTLGALTNVALALLKAPEIADRVKELVMMGGGFFEGGNITPAAEFNVYVDPQAADIVFRSGMPIVMMPLDVTHKLLTTKARVRRIRDIGTRPAIAMAEMLEFFERFDIEKYGSDGGPLHDPSSVKDWHRRVHFVEELGNAGFDELRRQRLRLPGEHGRRRGRELTGDIPEAGGGRGGLFLGFPQFGYDLGPAALRTFLLRRFVKGAVERRRHVHRKLKWYIILISRILISLIPDITCKVG